MATKKTYAQIFFLSLSILLLLSGCDFSSKPPNPPHSESTLVIDLFKSMRDKNFSEASNKLDRLVTIYPNNIYLSSIQTRLSDNLAITETQKILDTDGVDNAIISLHKVLEVRGQEPSLIDAMDQLKTLQEINNLSNRIIKEETSKQVAQSTGKLNRLIRNYPEAKALAEFTGISLNKARRLLAKERLYALENFQAMIDTSWVACSPYLDSMIASLEVASPNNPLVLAFRKSMDENWKNESFSSAYFDSNQEFILFRKGLIEDDANKHRIFKELLNITPDNYRNLLIKAILLQYAGYKKEAGKCINTLSRAFNSTQLDVKQWFQFIPANINEFSDINPFVIQPFFIYCDTKLSY